MLKRLFDVAFSAVGLLILWPVLAAVALWIKVDSRGPVFYRGVRVGRFGRPFRIFKFRTMVADAEARGGTSTASDDPRLTRCGEVLRRYKLDELPQLVNVLLGHMSVVGPRPQVQWAVDLYDEEERHLLDVRPGITDEASLRFRDEGELLKGHEDSDRAYMELIAPVKVRLGLAYVRSHSFLGDVRIILRTLAALVGFKEGPSGR